MSVDCEERMEHETMIDRLFRCINVEVSNKEREADLIRKFEKDELKLFYADYSSPFSVCVEGKIMRELLMSTNCTLFLSLQADGRSRIPGKSKIIQGVPSNKFTYVFSRSEIKFLAKWF
jgi:hypothetical protein